MIVAAADVIADHDRRRLSAAIVITRAGVSPRDFYAAFDSLEDCLAAAFDEGLARLTRAITAALPARATMHAKITSGLEALLAFLEAEPGWGRLLVGGLNERSRLQRQRAITSLAARLGDGRHWSHEDPTPAPSAADAEQLVREVLSVIASRMREGPGEPLRGLAPCLMSTLIEPEIGSGVGGALGEGVRPASRMSGTGASSGRNRLVLHAVAGNPGASNRQIAEASGVANDSNLARRLLRLQRTGLIRNIACRRGRGHPNAWVLSEPGPVQPGGSAVTSRSAVTGGRRSRVAA